MTASHVIDTTATTFTTEVLEASRSRPVLVDFWAPWCGPCRTLLPLLESLAAEYAGRFLLAKVNIDEQPPLAQQFGVRSVPTVKLLRDGRVVDEFLGAQPAATVRAFLDRHVEPLTAPQRRAALDAHAAGDLDGALALLTEACTTEPGHVAAWLDRLRLLLEGGRLDEARTLAEALPGEAREHPDASALLARLELSGSGTDDIDGLETRVAEAPEDCSARNALAGALAAAGRYDEALEQLLVSIRSDREYADGAARRAMLAIFTALGGTDPRVRDYRRRLASALN